MSLKRRRSSSCPFVPKRPKRRTEDEPPPVVHYDYETTGTPTSRRICLSNATYVCLRCLDPLLEQPTRATRRTETFRGGWCPRCFHWWRETHWLGRTPPAEKRRTPTKEKLI